MCEMGHAIISLGQGKYYFQKYLNKVLRELKIFLSDKYDSSQLIFCHHHACLIQSCPPCKRDIDPVYYTENKFAYRSNNKMFIDRPITRKIARDF